MNINDQLNQGQKEAGISNNGFFKFKNGDNRIRVLTPGAVIATHFFGVGQKAKTCYGSEKGCPYHGDMAPKDDKGHEKKPSIKYTCYVLDKSDGSIQVADLPYSVTKQIGDLQTNDDYKFDAFPMPYDITVKFNKESKSPNDMYKVIPSPKFEAVLQETIEKLNSLMSKNTPENMVTKKKSWQRDENIKSGVHKQETKEEFVNRVNSSNVQKNEDTIEYPVDEIDPNDIPF